MKRTKIVIDVKEHIYGDTARRSFIPYYGMKAMEIAGEGADVFLTGSGPAWLFVFLADDLIKGGVHSVRYKSPDTGKKVILK